MEDGLIRRHWQQRNQSKRTVVKSVSEVTQCENFRLNFRVPEEQGHKHVLLVVLFTQKQKGTFNKDYLHDNFRQEKEVRPSRSHTASEGTPISAWASRSGSLACPTTFQNGGTNE